MAHRVEDDGSDRAFIRRRRDDPDIANDPAAQTVARTIGAVGSAWWLYDDLIAEYHGPALEGPAVRKEIATFEENIGKVRNREVRSACRREWERTLAELVAEQDRQRTRWHLAARRAG